MSASTVRRTSRALPWLTALGLAVTLGLPARATPAGKNDAAATKLLDQALDDDYLNVKLDAAEAKLDKALALCGTARCSPVVLGKVHMGLAIVHGIGEKKLDVARTDLEAAAAADPNVALVDGLTSPDFEKLYRDVVAKASPAPPDASNGSDQDANGHGGNADQEPHGDDDHADASKGGGDKGAPDKSDTGSPLDKIFGLEVSGYLDNTATEVLSPSVKFSIENPLSGWGVEGSFAVDVVTSASTDIVATASPKWTDERYAPSLSTHFKAGDATLALGGDLSVESDFVGFGANLGASMDFRDKTITPTLTYAFGYDLAGRRGTPYSVYQRVLYSNTLQLGSDFVLDKSTILVPTLTATLEVGDQAKPYRYLPTFAPGTVLQPGASVAQVNAKRTDVVLEERLPQSRERYALSALLAHRFTDVTLRLDERVYVDSWGLKASTTDFMLPIDAGGHFRFWPHLRFNAQTGVDFWQLTYTAKETQTGIIASGLRAGDRELGPLLGTTFGAGFRAGGEDVGFTVAIDGIYTDFLDALYVTDRLAGFGSLGLEVKF